MLRTYIDLNLVYPGMVNLSSARRSSFRPGDFVKRENNIPDDGIAGWFGLVVSVSRVRNQGLRQDVRVVWSPPC